MNDSELKYKLLLNTVKEVGPVRMNRLLKYFGTAENVFKASISELTSVEDIGPEVAKEIINKRNKIHEIDNELELARMNNIKIITIDDSNYPLSLRHIPDPPPVLYIKGEIKDEDLKSVAVVGTRRPTVYGREVVRELVKDLAGLGVTIVSGLARGIDTEAHKYALDKSGRTIAVLGNGLLIHYPPENRRLEERIIQNGALISEFSLKTSPEKYNFPRRNRLIAGISLGVLVIEADEKSGALITARHALEQGKEVFAVPGSIFSMYSKGTHSLIKQGAKLVESIEDIIEEISELSEWLMKKTQLAGLEISVQQEIPSSLNNEEAKLIDILQYHPEGLHIDKIHDILKIPFGELSSLLLSLELKGYIRSLPGKLYMKL